MNGEPSRGSGETERGEPATSAPRANGAANTLSTSQAPSALTTHVPSSGRWSAARLPLVDRSSYAVDGEVAQGGIGRVLSARDQRLDRRVALKELLDTGSAAEDRFVREALLTARLQHPSIVPVYEAGRWPTGEPFYSMKLVTGRPLSEIIDGARTINERLPLLTHVLAVADAVAYAHEKRIIHRDLKPANVLVGAHGETLVIDWGLGKDLSEPVVDVAQTAAIEGGDDVASEGEGTLVDGITLVGSVMGTPAYMPPEQAAAEPVDERADVYALGAILYHLLAGRAPYAGVNGIKILQRVLEGPPTPLPKMQRGIPLDLLAIVDKAMARDPAARYPTAKALAEDLRRFLAGQLVGVHDYTTWEKAWRFARKHRATLAVAAAALCVLVTAGGLFFTKVLKERDRATREHAIAEEARKKAVEAEHRAVAHADELTLVQARAAVLRDPNEALAWLKTLSPAFDQWSSARVVAADAWVHGPAQVLRDQRGAVNRVDISKDGKRLAVASDDHTARIYDLTTGTSIELRGHEDEVWFVAFFPDEQRVLTTGKDRTIRIWDTSTGAAISTLRGHTRPIVFALPSRDGKEIVSHADDATVRAWNVATGAHRVLASNPDFTLKGAFSLDERHFVTAGKSGVLTLFDRTTGESFTLPEMRVHDATAQLLPRFPMGFSPDSRTLAAGGPDGAVWLWDIQKKDKPRKLEGQASAILRLTFAPDSKRLATAALDGTVRVWDLQAGTATTLPTYDGSVFAMAFSPDGRMLAYGGNDHAVRLVHFGTGERRRFVGMRDNVSDVLFSDDGTRLVVASVDGTARVFPLDATPGRVIGQHEGSAFEVDISPDGDHVLSAGADGVAQLWPTRGNGGGPAVTLAGHVGRVIHAEISPSGDVIATAGEDGTVRLWDTFGHEIRASHVEGARAPVIRFSPDGASIAVGHTTGDVALWDVDSGEMRALGRHEESVLALAFSADGSRLATGSADKTARVWTLATGKSRVLGGQEEAVESVAFSPDGKVVATGCLDHKLRIWDEGATTPRTYDASGYRVVGLSFTPDGETLLSLGEDATVRVWDVATGAMLRVLRGHNGPIRTLALAANGAALVTGSDDKTVRLWDLAIGEGRVLGTHDGVVQDVDIAPDGSWAVSVGRDGTVQVWPDDLPREPEALRAWIARSVPDTVEHFTGHMLVP
ncbi:serine/threonine-protein kinase [Polyangium sp. y55x31]|uniref:WD40 repeat domain-containing serine/threonine protein kinase n=1 Tax=Polyangium sp. y55x31 TaxID=3042688 RepID=UPI0024826286|nr:serine/threonine-protein kinase [Polyangium sp. y55x31]MDI1483534.1 serine/threonine-protein kinase [Polyangium sp. y55x31]